MKTLFGRKALKVLPGLLVGVMLLSVSACSGPKTSSEVTKAPDASATDRDKVMYMVQLNDPDSVARFLCYAALGKSTEGKIDSLALAQLYALEAYQADDDRIAEFSRAYEECVEQLPLVDMYRIHQMTGIFDETELPLDLGLHYGSRIMRDTLNAAKIKADTIALSRQMTPETFALFRKALKTAIGE